jgi:type VI secretion system protein ImpH
MASEDGRESSSLNRQLFQAPYRFDFFQAVRLLEHRSRERLRGDLGERVQPVGHDDPLDEVVSFRALPSLSFPAGSVNQIREVAGDRGKGRAGPLTEMVVSFLGLTGPSGVLPRHYTETLIGRIRERDYALRDFLDLFHHRMVSFFYRSWEKYKLPVGYERSQLDEAGAPDLVTRGLYSLVGLGTDKLRGRLEVDDEVFLHYSGHFSHFPRSASALQCLLEDYLEMPATVLQIQGQWLYLDPDDQASMPDARYPKGRNTQLGVNLIVGDRVWDVQSKFRLRLGPLTWRQFRSLMPDGPALRPLCQVTRSFVGPDLDFDVQPVLKPEEVPPLRLSPRLDEGSYLGWNTWVQSQPFVNPVADATFALVEI